MSNYFGASETVWLLYKTRSETGRTSAKVTATKSRRNFSQRTHPNHPISPYTDILVRFHTIWVHSGQFGCLLKLGAKRAELVQKFVPRTCVGIFRNERSRSTPLDPKLMFWCVSYYLGALRDCLVALRNSVQNGGELVQKFVSQSHFRIFRNERSRSTPMDRKLTFCRVPYYLDAFGTIW